MASACSGLRVTSYNLHGFNQGQHYLLQLCNSEDIIFVQEHWLIPNELDKLNNLHRDFIAFSSSAMSHAISRGILRGRPYGGVAVLIRKKYASYFSCLVCDERMVIVTAGNVVFVNLYLPTIVNAETKESVVDLLALLDGVTDDNSNKDVIIGGDLNFDFNNSNAICQMVTEFMLKHSLKRCDSIISHTISYTYHHSSLGQKSFIDHFIVSDNVYNAIAGGNIVEDGANLSDHNPVSINFSDCSWLKLSHSNTSTGCTGSALHRRRR